MYCTCSNKNNYEIIFLCDIKKFTHKNGPFDNKKAWVQISIADILTLDCNKHAIEKIEKIYIDVTIVSTKIIETPISPAPNSEGMTLTGKKLLIDGFICSKIVYTSLTKEQSVYSSNFTIPFCTYIVIEGNADAFNDKYCIKTCIEDVFLSLIDCKTIFQNVTIFLLAEKTSLTCPNAQPPKEDCTITNFSNTIILNDLSDNPVITISFDKANKKILVNSTGKITDPAGVDDYFVFTLYGSDGMTEKFTATINGNENGEHFSNIISNMDFQEGDIVTIEADSPDKVIITNFPDSNTPRYILTEKEINFKINQNDLAIIKPPEIIIKKTDGSIFGTIAFHMRSKKLILTGFSGKYSSGTDDYSVLNFRLYTTNGRRTKAITLNSLKDANAFFTDLNNAPFDINSVLELAYDDKSKTSINVTNFPNLSDIHTPTVVREYYKITDQGFKSHIPIPDTIKYLKSDGSTSYVINLDLIKKVASCSIVSRNKNTDLSAFVIKINRNLSAEIFNRTDFILYAEGGKFDYDNSTIQIDFRRANYSVVLVNYPTIGATYTLPNNLDTIEQKITINGIKA